ncbi:S24 family peptidase [Thiohalobacter sp. IOR34]|uniref:S24 family peptidase n=1 Tax=Thiohalobacter sp. IOR34 TaxID=3057176 RepID=UPI0025B23F95|nr:S24 family peptidase [Thiohalobacter sp. IOR34]WJW74369.1 S24 family peptidase [Thiohalobacter sp. IOR34]
MSEDNPEFEIPKIEGGGACAEEELFALQVLDDSMEPEFAKGCIIIIDPGGIIQNGCFVLARHEEDNFIFRQLLIQEDRYYLKPMRSSYETIEIPGLEVIVGVIVQRAGTRRSYHKHYV